MCIMDENSKIACDGCDLRLTWASGISFGICRNVSLCNFRAWNVITHFDPRPLRTINRVICLIDILSRHSISKIINCYWFDSSYLTVVKNRQIVTCDAGCTAFAVVVQTSSISIIWEAFSFEAGAVHKIAEICSWNLLLFGLLPFAMDFSCFCFFFRISWNSLSFSSDSG